jgi:hypothetical protein
MGTHGGIKGRTSWGQLLLSFGQVIRRLISCQASSLLGVFAGIGFIGWYSW